MTQAVVRTVAKTLRQGLVRNGWPSRYESLPIPTGALAGTVVVHGRSGLTMRSVRANVPDQVEGLMTLCRFDVLYG